MAFVHDNIKPFSEEGSKKEQIGVMFDNIAPRYDFLNRFLSAGIDVSWRKKAIKTLIKHQPQFILDVATGTGDMAILASRMLKPKKITGIDISEKMLEIGRRKYEAKNINNIELVYGDSETIIFNDNTFDAVTVAFGVRNFENLQKGLNEILRVLKPGGKLVVLEFSKPLIPGVKQLYNLYMGIIAPEIAAWFSRNKRAYKYLNRSAKAFPDRNKFVEIVKDVGYTETSFKSLSLGICCIYLAKKPL